MRLGILFALLLGSSSVAFAQPGTQPQPQQQPQPQPQPQPYPPQPYPPQPYPYPYYYPPPPPPKKAEPKPPVPMQVLFHGLCPEDTEPMCGGGLWMGLRGTTLVGAGQEDTFGLALDLGLGFSFGFGWEVGSNIEPDERDEMAFVTAIAEAAVGPGIRAGKVDILPAIGIGGEAVAWGTTDRDDDPYSEGFWYGVLATRIHLDGYSLVASTTQKFANRHGISDSYMTGVEGGMVWETEKGKMGFAIVYQHFDTHVIGGFAIVAELGDVKPKPLVPGLDPFN